jgi:hypothetical protein
MIQKNKHYNKDSLYEALYRQHFILRFMHQTVILLKIIIKDSDNYCNVLFAPLHSDVLRQ